MTATLSSSSESGDPKEILRLLNGAVDYTVAELNHKVFKDECMYCFHTPYSSSGLFVCLRTFVGFCNRHIHSYARSTGAKVFLVIKKRKIVAPESEEPKDKMQKLCIRAEKEENIEEFSLVVYPHLDNRLELSAEILGENLYGACRSVIDHTSASMQDRLESGVSEWDGEARQTLKPEELVQLTCDKQIPYSGWVCEEPGCGLTENLWLNLTDGTIMCGRTQYIREGVMSKGNGHAKLHYEKTGYPLLVKLGTISNGDADVYSYVANDSVYDPELAKHLAHFGLDVNKFEKTEKSTLELELDLNQQWEWTRCQEAGVTLENVYGPGFTGLINIGSSCYINSVLQILQLTPDFVNTYGKRAEEIFNSFVSAAQTHDDFNCQLAKVVNCLLSGDYAQADSEANGIKPTQFRRVTGKGHVEFSTSKQQDAEEYIRHLFEKIDNSVTGPINPVNAFRFKVVTRFEDTDSNRVRYTTREDSLLSLNVPLEKALPAREDAENGPKDRKIVSLTTCLEHAFADEIIDDFTSPITGNKRGATQRIRMGSFPDFLLVQIRRFAIAEDWTIKKLDLDVLVDEEVDLSGFRAADPSPDEQLLPDDAGVAQPTPNLDQETINGLTAMGFSLNAARRATYETKNSGLEAAAEWLMQHLDDPNINEEHPDLKPRGATAAASTTSNSAIDPELVANLTAFGFTEHQAKYGLKMARGDLNAAADWLFNNVDQVPPEEMETSASTQNLASKETRDGNGRYVLRGFISHMGRSPHSGHYVAHVKKDGKWYLFNDEKVAISQNPPISLGYIYLFQRV